MKVAVLEFKLLDDFFCFNTKDVDYVFDLEEYKEFSGFHESVIGVTKYNHDVILLIDTAKLYSDKLLDLSTQKSVVVIHDESGMRYGMVVDEIIKIDEFEAVKALVDLNTEDIVVNHYKNQERIVNEIYPLPLLKKYKIPAMAGEVKKSFDTLKALEKKDTQSFLVFKVVEKLYALSTKYLKEVLQNDAKLFEIDEDASELKGAIAVRDEIIQVVLLDENQNSNDMLVLEHNGQKLALEIDEIFDIEYFNVSHIQEVNKNGKISSFYNHNGDVIAIINPLYFFEKFTQQNNVSTHNEEVQINTKLEYLIFKLGVEKYAISMKCVRQVVETDSLAKTQSSAIVNNDDVEFIATLNAHAVSVVKLNNLLGIKEYDNEASQSIFVEVDGKYIAFIVSDIEDIVYVVQEDVSRVSSEKSVVSGAILHENEVIVTLDEAYLCNIG